MKLDRQIDRGLNTGEELKQRRKHNSYLVDEYPVTSLDIRYTN